MILESVLLNFSHTTKLTPANLLFRHFLLSSQIVNQLTSGLTSTAYGYKPLNEAAAMKLEDKTAVQQVMKTILFTMHFLMQHYVKQIFLLKMFLICSFL